MLIVNDHVTQKVRLLVESSITNRANEGFEASMGERMSF
jgi:hypothetical protein